MVEMTKQSYYMHIFVEKVRTKEISSSAPSVTPLNLSVVEEDRMENRLICLLVLKITTTFTTSQCTRT